MNSLQMLFWWNACNIFWVLNVKKKNLKFGKIAHSADEFSTDAFEACNNL